MIIKKKNTSDLIWYLLYVRVQWYSIWVTVGIGTYLIYSTKLKYTMCLFFENNDNFSYVVNSYIYYFVHVFMHFYYLTN